MPSGQSDPLEQRVLLLTPTQRDGELARAMLAEAGVAADSCRDVVALGVELQRPVGAVMLPEESLSQGGMQLLAS